MSSQNPRLSRLLYKDTAQRFSKKNDEWICVFTNMVPANSKYQVLIDLISLEIDFGWGLGHSNIGYIYIGLAI